MYDLVCFIRGLNLLKFKLFTIGLGVLSPLKYVYLILATVGTSYCNHFRPNFLALQNGTSLAKTA